MGGPVLDPVPEVEQSGAIGGVRTASPVPSFTETSSVTVLNTTFLTDPVIEPVRGPSSVSMLNRTLKLEMLPVITPPTSSPH
ncbi:hypothetical protein ACWCXX_09120 [Streptomyces sp. NPDC001732]